MDCGSVSTCEIALSMNYRAEATLEQDYLELKYGHGGGKKNRERETHPPSHYQPPATPLTGLLDNSCVYTASTVLYTSQAHLVWDAYSRVQICI